MVQTNEQWWETAKLIQYVDSQEEFNHYNKYFAKYTWMKSFNLWRENSRSILFWTRFYAMAACFRLHFRIPSNFGFMKPGLEIKFACEEAEKINAKTYFLGPEFDQVTW